MDNQEFYRLGGIRSLRSDARIVAATRRHLDRAIRMGAFRQDLFFRLNGIGLKLPPLRERPEDIEDLARHGSESMDVRSMRRRATGFRSFRLMGSRFAKWSAAWCRWTFLESGCQFG